MENKISTSELRLGNWVYDGKNTKFPMQVETIMKDCVYLDFEGNEGDVHECTGKEIEPIPFTEKLIKGLGWDQELTYIGSIEFIVSEENKSIILTPSINCEDYTIGKSLKYIHQLQNVVFALSGEKLEIKREYL